MKNWLFALSGLLDLAIEQAPLPCLRLLNSAGMSGLSEPPVPTRPSLNFFYVAELYVTRLGHKTVYHPMEGDAVVLSRFCEFFYPGHMFGRGIGVHLDDDLSVIQIDEQGVFGIYIGLGFGVGHCDGKDKRGYRE